MASLQDLGKDMQGSSLELPPGYYLERDPDILILRRLDGAKVGAFSARGAVLNAVRQAAEEELREEPSTQRWEAPTSDAIQPSLQARFFGHFESALQRRALSPWAATAKLRTILKYLLANRFRPVSQDYLMGWLWPESNLKRARWSLNSAIHSCAISSASVPRRPLELRLARGGLLPAVFGGSGDNRRGRVRSPLRGGSAPGERGPGGGGGR